MNITHYLTAQPIPSYDYTMSTYCHAIQLCKRYSIPFQPMTPTKLESTYLKLKETWNCWRWCSSIDRWYLWFVCIYGSTCPSGTESQSPLLRSSQISNLFTRVSLAIYSNFWSQGVRCPRIDETQQASLDFYLSRSLHHETHPHFGARDLILRYRTRRMRYPFNLFQLVVSTMLNERHMIVC